MKISDALTEKLLVIADKIANQKHMYAIKTAFTTLMPVIITGAFCTLIVNVVCSTTTTGISLAKVGGFAWLEMFTDLFNAANYATLNFFTVAAVVLIGLELGVKNKIKGFMPGIVAVCSFVACLSTNLVATIGDQSVTIAGLSKDYTASKGLFLGMIIALVSVELFTKLCKSKYLKINMPDSVPPNVTNSFNNLFPFALTVLICATINFVAFKTINLSLYDIIYTFVQQPLQAVVQGLPGVLILMLVAQIFWCVGIHGNQIIKPVRDPLLNAAILANTELVANPNYNPADLNIISMSFWDTYGNIGGSGCVTGLLIACLLFSRREDYKQVAKLSIMPGIFNISETMHFGLPIMLNPLLMIPFILAPLITMAFGYLMTVIGFAGVLMYAFPWTTPPVINAWIASGGNIGTIVTQLLCILITIGVYAPFVMIANRQRNADETVEA